MTESKFNHTGLRIFGPNATVGVLGKFCFDLSNNLQGETIHFTEMRSILDWIGFSVDIASLKTFFSQRALTVCAVWEALNSTVKRQRHAAAFDVLLAVHLSIMGQAPWITGSTWEDFSSCVRLAPSRAANLISRFHCAQVELDKALQDAVEHSCPIDHELVKHLISAGASLKNRNCSVDNLIPVFNDRKCEAADITLLKMLLEAGALVDEILPNGSNLGDLPFYTTDYFLLSEYASSKSESRSEELFGLVSLYSNRQKNAVTVPGILGAAQGGQESLCSYLEARLKPHDDRERKILLEVALSHACGRGLSDAVQSLVQFGVDLNIRTLLQAQQFTWRSNSWHPVIRAANAGDAGTLRILATAPSLDIAFLPENEGKKKYFQFNLSQLHYMGDDRRDQTLKALSAFAFPTSFRGELLLSAIVDIELHRDANGGPDFRYLSQLLELGLACIDRGERPNDDTKHILVRALMRGYDVRKMTYLIDLDEEIVSGLSDGTMKAIFEAILQRKDGQQETLEFFAKNVEGFRSYIQERGSSLLPKCLQCSRLHGPETGHGECEAMVTVKWLLGVGGTLTAPCCLAKLMHHADDSFMLESIRSVADANADDIYEALQESISTGRLNLAVAIIERGCPVNSPPGWSGMLTALQAACESNAPLWFMEYLIDNGADVNAPPEPVGGRTALQAACDCGAQLACISLLVDRGADVNAPAAPVWGLTALQYAARSGSMNVVGLLLDHGADVHAISGCWWNKEAYSYFRAVDLAADMSRLDMVHFLIAAGARSSQPGRTGFDGAVELVTEERNLVVARMLREYSDTHSGDPMEAERGWLRANPQACMYQGTIRGAAWVDFVEQSGGENEKDFSKKVLDLAKGI